MRGLDSINSFSQKTSDVELILIIYFFHRFDMPANKSSRDPRVRAYDPLQEAHAPVQNATWERRVAKTSLGVRKQSDAFKIPRTSRQAPSTVMPNPPYEALNLTNADSRKAKPRPHAGAKRGHGRERERGAEAKMAHLKWLHEKGIPDMDREIMKTNSLVDNILAEQNDLDAQMLAIKAMGGVQAYNQAYRAHNNLRRAIAKRLDDTKRNRAKQFEAIRSMRTMMRTLVAELDANYDNRRAVQQPKQILIGAVRNLYYIKATNLTNYIMFFANPGPNPRSLLCPEINMDTVRPVSHPSTSHGPAVTTLLPTPPVTPPPARSPVFSDTDDDSYELEDPLSPISSPRPGPDDSYYSPEYVPGIRPCCDLSLLHRKWKDSCCCSCSVSLSSWASQARSRQYIRHTNLVFSISWLSSLIKSGSIFSIKYPYSKYISYVSSPNRPISIISTFDGNNREWAENGCGLGNNYIIMYCRSTPPVSGSTPGLDLLQAAATAAGIADDDACTTYSVDSPTQVAPQSPPSAPISEPNRRLISLSDTTMPKNRNKGATGDTPTKSPRREGNTHDNNSNYGHHETGTHFIFRQQIQYQYTTNLLTTLTQLIINYAKHKTSYAADNNDDDILDMSGIQEGSESAHSSELDNTVREDPPPPEETQGAAGGQAPDGSKAKQSFGPRQNTPNRDTPKSSHPEDDTEKESESESTSDSEDDDDDKEDLDAGSAAQRDLQNDLSKVREAVSLAGGLASNKPDFEKQKDRVGQHVEVVEEWVDLTEETFDDLPERPAENTLRRISLKELFPPATSMPVPLDMEIDGDELSFVANQRIEFLVLMRKEGDAKTSWGFPSEAQLLKMYNYVRDVADHDLIMDVCLWCRVDAKTGIASIMLSTIHLPLFKRIRHEIRVYAGFPGFRCETYSKITFMQKYGVTLYIPKEVAGMNEKRLFKTLFRKYRHLNVRFLILTRTTFTRDHPDKPPHKRSRIGDRILLLDGPALYEVLKTEPEDKKYFLNDGFSVTLRGGIRSTGPTSLFASSFASQVISGLPHETMRQAEDRA